MISIGSGAHNSGTRKRFADWKLACLWDVFLGSSKEMVLKQGAVE